MKRNMLILISFFGAMLIGCAANTPPVSPDNPLVHRGGRGQGFRTHMHYYVPHSCAREGTGLCKPGVVTGVIRQMSLEKSKFEAYPGLTAEIQTLDKELVHVHIAPEWVLARHQINLRVNDEVSLNGVFHEMEGKDGLVASELTWKGQTVFLRDAQGHPKWELQHAK